MVSELKNLLRGSTTIESSRQRLIFRGRVLQDDLPLRDYSISSGHVLHMVARPVTDVEHSNDSNRNVPELPLSSSSSLQSTENRNSQFPHQNQGHSQSIPSTQAGQLLSLSRNELELLNHLLSSEAHTRDESYQISQIQQQQNQQQRLQQQQQLYTSDISSFSFQQSSRFSLPVPIGANISSTVPSTATPSRNNMNTTFDSIERIRQGLLTMETILSTMDDFQPPAVSLPSITATSSATTNQSNRTFRSIFNEIEPSNILNDSAHMDGKSVTTDKSEKESVGNKKFEQEVPISSSSADENTKMDSMASMEPYNMIPITRTTLEGVTGSIKSNEERTAVSTSVSVPVTVQESNRSNSISNDRNQNELKTHRYYVGQWIDVKDTVSQWLEATVILVDLDRRSVFVHYNGW